jgi:hypothetical protein
MPLLKGKENIGHNVETEENAGKPKKQAVAIALREAGVPKAKDAGTVTVPNAGIPAAARRPAEDGSYSAGDMWMGRQS